MSDLKDIIQTGLEIYDKTVNIKLRCIVCDAPARAKARQCRQYSGYYGYERYTQKGSWLRKVTYPEADDLTMRTDQSFRAQSQPEHHMGISPFCDLPIDMVCAFP